MSAVNIIKDKTCAFTGHRILCDNFDKNEIVKIVQDLIKRGYDTFLIGMALGFDTECFKVLINLRKSADIRLIACVPCNSQSKFFKKKQLEEYQKLISEADEVVNVSDDYYDGCMMVRNYFMVDNSSVIIAYLNYNRGGTYRTVKYAAENGKEIIYVGK